MLGIANFHKELMRRVGALAPGHALDVRTYKRNRSVVFVAQGGGRYRVVESGFEERDFVIGEKRLSRTLKELRRREFPRSNKVRVYDLGEYDPDAAAPAQRKVL